MSEAEPSFQDYLKEVPGESSSATNFHNADDLQRDAIEFAASHEEPHELTHDSRQETTEPQSPEVVAAMNASLDIDEETDALLTESSLMHSSSVRSTPPRQPRQQPSSRTPLSPFSPLSRYRRPRPGAVVSWTSTSNGGDSSAQQQQQLSLVPCRKVSIIVRVKPPAKNGDGSSGGKLCLFPLVAADSPPLVETTTTSDDGQHYLTPQSPVTATLQAASASSSSIAETKDLVVVNPSAFGKYIPAKVTMETARLVAQVANIESEDWARRYRFDDVLWPPESETALIKLSQSAANDALLRHCSTICFGFGGADSGKTYTLLGSATTQPKKRSSSINGGDESNLSTSHMVLERYGLLGMTLQCLWEQSSICTLSLMEIVEEDHLRDLLATSYDPYSSKTTSPLRIRHPDNQGAVVEHLTEIPVDSLEGLDNYIRRAFHSKSARRARKREGPRGHVIATIKVWHINEDDLDSDNYDGETECTVLGFVDLSSGESMMESQQNGVDSLQYGEASRQARRIASIRKSVSGLRGVLRGLLLKESAAAADKSGQQPPISFRECTLTKLLQRTLDQPDSRAVMVATVCPRSESYDRTLQTLNYANRLLVRPGRTARSPFDGTTATKDGASTPETSPTLDQFTDEDALLKSILSDPRQRMAKLMTARSPKPSDDVIPKKLEDDLLDDDGEPYEPYDYMQIDPRIINKIMSGPNESVSQQQSDHQEDDNMMPVKRTLWKEGDSTTGVTEETRERSTGIERGYGDEHDGGKWDVAGPGNDSQLQRAAPQAAIRGIAKVPETLSNRGLDDLYQEDTAGSPVDKPTSARQLAAADISPLTPQSVVSQTERPSDEDTPSTDVHEMTRDGKVPAQHSVITYGDGGVSVDQGVEVLHVDPNAEAGNKELYRFPIEQTRAEDQTGGTLEYHVDFPRHLEESDQTLHLDLRNVDVGERTETTATSANLSSFDDMHEQDVDSRMQRKQEEKRRRIASEAQLLKKEEEEEDRQIAEEVRRLEAEEEERNHLAEQKTKLQMMQTEEVERQRQADELHEQSLADQQVSEQYRVASKPHVAREFQDSNEQAPLQREDSASDVLRKKLGRFRNDIAERSRREKTFLEEPQSHPPDLNSLLSEFSEEEDVDLRDTSLDRSYRGNAELPSVNAIDEINVLETAVDEIRRNHAGLWESSASSLARLRESQSSIQQRLESAISDRDEARKEAISARKQLIRQRNEHSDSVHHLEQLETKLGEALSDRMSIEKIAEEAIAAQDVLEKHISGLNGVVHSSQNEKEEALAKYAKAHESARSLSLEVETLNEQINSVRSGKEKSDTEVLQLKQTIARQENEISHLVDARDQAQEQKSKLLEEEKLREGLKQEMDMMSDEVSRLKLENNDLRTSLSQKERQAAEMSEQKADLSRMKVEVRDLRNQLESSRNQFDGESLELVRSIQALEEERSSLLTEIDEANYKLEANRAQMATVVQENEAAVAEANNRDEMVNEKDKQISKLRAELDGLRLERDNDRKRFIKLEQEGSTLHKDATARLEKSKIEHESTAALLKKALDENRAHEDVNARLHEAVEKLQRERDFSQESLSAFREQFENEQHVKYQAEADSEHLKSKLEESERTIDKLREEVSTLNETKYLSSRRSDQPEIFLRRELATEKEKNEEVRSKLLNELHEAYAEIERLQHSSAHGEGNRAVELQRENDILRALVGSGRHTEVSRAQPYGDSHDVVPLATFNAEKVRRVRADEITAVVAARAKAALEDRNEEIMNLKLELAGTMDEKELEICRLRAKLHSLERHRAGDHPAAGKRR